MYDLLDYIVKNYQNGGYINPFNPSESPTQSGVLSSSGIDLTDDKYKAFIPTYDQTGEDFLRTNYIQKREGSYSTARDTLGQLGQKSRETKAQQGFAGSGKSLLDTTRKDIVDQFSMDADSMYTGLQQDVTGMRRGYEEEVLAAVGDLEPDAYTLDGTDDDKGYDFSGEGGSPTMGVGAVSPTHSYLETITNPNTGQVWVYDMYTNWGTSPPTSYYYWRKA